MSTQENETGTAQSSTKLAVFYDGACPLCVREIRWLERRMSAPPPIQLIDIASPTFDVLSTGKTFEDLMGQLHAR